MIDTMRFEIPYSKKLVKAIFKAGINVNVSYDSGSKEINYRYFRGNKNLGSYDRAVNLFVYEDREKIYLELSLPKFVFGHNVFMLYPNELEKQIWFVWANLGRVYNTTFPFPKEWLVNRVDICYSWKFDTQEQAESVLYHLKNFKYPRKEKSVFRTGVFLKSGRMHTLKFYLKQPEFFVHDFKKLKRSADTVVMAYRFHAWSAGVLRFEVTLKLDYINKYFEGRKLSGFYDNLKIELLLNEFLSTYMSVENKSFMTVETAIKKLESIYPKSKAQRLATFWYISSTHDSELVDLLFNYSRTQVYMNKRDLIDADIGIYSPDRDSEKNNLTIPSSISTNEPLLTTPQQAVAEGVGGEPTIYD